MTKTADGGARSDLSPWWWRHRFRLMPVYLVVLTSALGLASFQLEEVQFWVSWGAVTFLWFVLVRNRYGGRGGNAQKLVFHLFVEAAVLSLIAAIRFQPIAMGSLFAVVLVVGVVLTIFWYTDRQNLTRVKLEREQEAWPEVAERLGIPNVRRSAMKVTETGREWWLTWGPGDATVKRVKSLGDALEGEFGIPVGQIKFVEKLNDRGFQDPHCIKITENTGSKIHKETVAFVEPTMRRITDEMLLGPYEDGSMCKVRWYVKGWGAKHTISGGKTGSGKSSLFDLFFAESARCPDLVRWGMDRKGGIAIAPWASMFDWQATTDKACVSMLSALKEVLEERAKILAEKQNEWGKCWKASPKYPVLVVILDEAAEILGMSAGPGMSAVDLVSSAVRRARQLGVMIFLAVQHLSLESIGSTQITNNCDRRFCFGMKTSAQQYSIIAGSGGEFDATQVQLPDQAGTFWWTDGGAPVKTAGRVRYVNERKIREIVLAVGDNVADLDPRSAWAASRGSAEFEEDSYDRREHVLVEDLPPLTFDADADPDGYDPDYDDDRPESHPDDPDNTEDPDSRPEDPDDDADLGSDDDPTVGVLTDPDDAAALLAEHLAGRDVSTEEGHRRLDGALDGAPRQGIARRHLLPIVGMSPSWTSREVAARLSRGEIEALGQGSNIRYRRPVDEQRPDLKVVK